MSDLLHPWQQVQYRLSLLCAAIAAISMALSCTATAQWTKIAGPQVADVFFYNVDFENESVGYAIGSTSSATSVYKTTDGGVSWTALKGLGLSPFNFIFFDENTGVVGGRAPGCKCTALSRTTDGGKTWKLDSIRSPDGTIQQVPASFGINVFSMYNSTTAYAAGSNGVIVKTADAGATWIRTNVTSTTDFMAGISLGSEEKVYGIAAPITNLYSPNIFYRTTNAGQSWQSVPDFVSGAGFGELKFIGPETGFAGGGNGSQAVIYKTIDGGGSWNMKHAAGDAQSSIYGINFVDHNTGYAIGSNGLILRTDNGGETWTPEISGSTEPLQGISITDKNVYVVGRNGTVLRRSLGASGVGPGPGASEATRVMLTPNPITTSATVSHPGLAREGGYLAIYDLLGREARRIPGGTATLQFSREGLASGSYIYRIIVGAEVVATGTMMVQ